MSISFRAAILEEEGSELFQDPTAELPSVGHGDLHRIPPRSAAVRITLRLQSCWGAGSTYRYNKRELRIPLHHPMTSDDFRIKETLGGRMSTFRSFIKPDTAYLCLTPAAQGLAKLVKIDQITPRVFVDTRTA